MTTNDERPWFSWATKRPDYPLRADGLTIHEYELALLAEDNARCSAGYPGDCPGKES